MKKLGIIGGLGPETTAEFYLEVIFACRKFNKIIHNLVINRQGNMEREDLMKIIEKFKGRGIKHVILACTDLQLLLPHHKDVKIHDTMKILADAAIREILR